MENKRETKEFVTKGGNKIVYKTYITGREANEIDKVYLKDTKINLIGQDVKIDGFDPSSEYEANKKMFELLVVSVNDISEKTEDLILDLPNEEYKEILNLMSTVSGKKK